MSGTGGTLCFFLVLAVCLPVVQGIAIYFGYDGLRYETPLYCQNQSLSYALFYNVQSSNFTVRDNEDCCVFATSRSECCVDEIVLGDGSKEMVCKCDPQIECGLPSNSEAFSTQPPQTTTATIAEATTTTEQGTTMTTTWPTTSTAEGSTTTMTTTGSITSTTEGSTTKMTTTGSITSTTEGSTTTMTTTGPTTSTTEGSTTTMTTTGPTTSTAEGSTTKMTTTGSITSTTEGSITTDQATTTSSPLSFGTATWTMVSTTTATPMTSHCTTNMVENDPVDNACIFFPYILKIIDRDDKRKLCNAVFTNASVGGNWKRTFLTTSHCLQSIQNSTGAYLELAPGISLLPIDLFFNLIEGPHETAFIDIQPTYGNVLSILDCNPACGNSQRSISVDLDYADCLMLRHGALNDTSCPLGVYKVQLYFNPYGCSCKPQGTLCFSSSGGNFRYCDEDTGAPVYCRARSNGEFILMGVTGYTGDCDMHRDIFVHLLPRLIDT